VRERVGIKAFAAALATGAIGLAAPSIAQGQVTQVFTDTATPVDCTVQTGANDGINFCTNQAGEPRSTVPTWDGVPLDVNVAFPREDAYGEGPYPVMMLFHGYAGSKIGLSGMKHWLDQGYATFSMTTRGNHQSCGTQAARDAGGAACDDGYLRLMDTRYEVRDAQELIALLVDEGLVDADRIGATGGSYGGGMSMALAALRNRKMLPDGSLTAWESPEGTPLRIAGAAPDIPWTDLAYALVPNGGNLDYIADAPYFGHVGRVGVEKQAYVNALYASGQANGYYAPQGEDPDADLTGWKAELDTGGPYGAETVEIVEEITSHHSSYYIDDSIKPAPLLISSGFTDDLFPANEATRYFNRTLTTYPNAHLGLTFGDFGHPRGQGRAETNSFIAARKDEWLAHYVLGEGAQPDEGIDALTQTCGEPPAGPYHGTDVDDLAPGEITHQSAPAQTIDPGGAVGDVLFGGSFGLFSNSCANVAAGDSPAGAIYKLDAAPAGGYTLLGSPTVIADFDAPGDNTQVAARLMDIAPDGTQKLIARGLWRPEIGGPERQVFQLTPNGWEFEEGHVAKLELLPYDDPYGRRSPGQQAVEVSDLELRLPVADLPGSLGGLVDEALPVVLPEGTEAAPGFDETAPETSVNLTRKGKDVKARFFSTEEDSTFECKRRLVWRRCESPKVFKTQIHKRPRLNVRAIDPQGNVDPTPARVRLDSVFDDPN
jgi:hypothetical protein